MGYVGSEQKHQPKHQNQSVDQSIFILGKKIKMYNKMKSEFTIKLSRIKWIKTKIQTNNSVATITVDSCQYAS